jgi:hypothetical protein
MPERITPRAEIRSEAHGSHWIAWRVDAYGKPEGSVVVVAETREEAEERVSRLGEQDPR